MAKELENERWLNIYIIIFIYIHIFHTKKNTPSFLFLSVRFVCIFRPSLGLVMHTLHIDLTGAIFRSYINIPRLVRPVRILI